MAGGAGQTAEAKRDAERRPLAHALGKMSRVRRARRDVDRSGARAAVVRARAARSYADDAKWAYHAYQYAWAVACVCLFLVGWALWRTGGDVVEFSDDDDVWHAHHLSMHVLAYSQVPDAAFVYSAGIINGNAVSPALDLIMQTPFASSSNDTMLRLAPPRPCNLLTSSTSHRIDHPVAAVRARPYSEQIRIRRQCLTCRKWSLFQRCSPYKLGLERGYMQGDLDYFEQV